MTRLKPIALSPSAYLVQRIRYRLSWVWPVLGALAMFLIGAAWLVAVLA